MWRGKGDVFVRECSSTSERFIKPVHKTTITTFASGNFERKNKSKKVAELQVTKGTGDLFGRLLYLSATNGIDLESVFSFPILPEPACFTYPDGTIIQNDKSTVFHPSDHCTHCSWDVYFKLKHSEPSQNTFSARQKHFR